MIDLNNASQAAVARNLSWYRADLEELDADIAAAIPLLYAVHVPDLEFIETDAATRHVVTFNVENIGDMSDVYSE